MDASDDWEAFNAVALRGGLIHSIIQLTALMRWA